MRTNYFAVALFLFCSVSLFAQIQSFQNNQYEKIDGVWHLISETDNMRFPIMNETLTIKFNDGVSATEIQNFEQQNNLTFLRQALTGWRDYQVPAGVDIFAISNNMYSSTLVNNLEIPTIGFYIADADDTLYGNLWHIKQGTDRDMDVDLAWDLETGDPSVIVAVLDSGTDWEHPDLGMGADSYETTYLNPGEDAWTDPLDPSTGNGVDDDGNGLIDDWKGYNFANNFNDARQSPSGQRFYHGSHVAGIVAAKTNNAEGVSGIAGGWNDEGAKLMPLAVGITGPVGAVLDDAILYAAEMGAGQVQLSLTVGASAAINDAVEMAYDDYGVIIVNAAGNSGNPNAVGYPGTLEKVWAIGATTTSDTKAGFSQGGPDLFVSAPGVSIWSTQMTTSSSLYDTSSGTSFASPGVSGVIALILSANPGLTQDDVRQILIDTSEKVGNYDYDWDPGMPGHSRELGYGRVNAFAAVEAAQLLSVNDFGNNGQVISVSPNPATDQLNLRFKEAPTGDVSIEIYNINGQQMVSVPEARAINGSLFSLDVDSLSSGIYILRVNNANAVMNTKFIKR